MTEKEKIREYLRSKGITPHEFSKVTGLSNGFLNSGSGIGTDKLKIIISHYRDLNLRWLLSDEDETIALGTEKSKPYYQANDTIDVVNEKEGSKLSILQALNKYLDEKIEQKDRKIIQLSLENEAIKKELNELKKL